MTEIVITLILVMIGALVVRKAQTRISGEFRSSDVAVAIRRQRRGR